MPALAEESRLEVKVYYEDTDSMGVVYHANYLKFLERARTELFAASGRPVAEWNQLGHNFAIYQANVRFQAPARLGDVCEVITRPREASTYRMIMDQEIFCEGRRLVRAEIHIVCLDSDFKLSEIPSELRQVGSATRVAD